MRIQGRVLFILVFVWSLQPAFGQNWQKFLDKIDVQYRAGNYSKADKLNERLKKKSSRKLGTDNPFFVDYFLKKARTDLALGQLSLIDNELNTAVQLSSKNFGAGSPQHALNILRAADLYTMEGNMVEADTLARQAEEILRQGNHDDEGYKVLSDFVKMKINGGMGFYWEAAKTGMDIRPDMFKRIATKGNRFDPVTKTEKKVNFSKTEVEQFGSDYAFLLAYTAYCMGEYGDFSKADSLFGAADQWIRKNRGKINFDYAQYQVMRADIDDLKGDWKNSRNLYHDAYLNAKTSLKPAHYLIYLAHEKLIGSYMTGDRDTKAVNEFLTYDRAVSKYFSRTSLYRLRADFLDLRLNKDNKDLGRQEKQAVSILNTSFLPVYHPLRADVLEHLIQILIKEQKYNLVSTYLDNLLTVRQTLLGDQAPNYHKARILAGKFYINYTNRVVEARDIYQKSFLNIVSKTLSPDHPAMADYYRFASQVEYESDQFDGARTDMIKAMQIIRKKYGEESVPYGNELDDLSNLCIDISDFRNADNYITSANTILRKEAEDEDQAYYASAMETQAKLLRMQGNYDDAISMIKRSQKLIRKAEIVNYNDFKGLETLADVNLSLGKFSSTEDLLTESITRKEELFGKDSKFLIQPLLRYGDLLIINGDYPQAEHSIQRASDITSKVYGENSSRFAECLVQQAKLRMALGDFEEGEKMANQALGIQKAVFKDNNIILSNTLSLLGEISFYKGENIKEVENHFLESEAVIIKLLGSDNPLFAENLKNLGIIFLAKKDYQRALAVLQQAKTIWQNKTGKRNNINSADINVLIGDVYYGMKDYDNAQKYYYEAQRLYKKFFSDSHPKYVKTISKLSKVSFMQGDMKAAKNYIEAALKNYLQFINNYFPSLSERGKAKFWSSIKSDFEYYNTLALTLNSQYPDMISTLYNNTLATKALLLNSSIKIRERILSSSDTTLQRLYYEWKDKNELLTNALSMSPEELQEEGINPDKLKDDIEKIEQELSSKTTGFAGVYEKKSINWENIKSALKPSEVAMEMIRSRYFNHDFTDSVFYLGLYVTASDKTPKYIVFRDGKDMESRYFSSYRNSIRFKLADQTSYDNFWKPIEQAVGKTATLYLSPDGVFNQINLEAIPTPDGNYVIDNSNIILVNNTKDLYLVRVMGGAGSNDKTATLVGNPRFYASAGNGQNIMSREGTTVTSLPGTQTEIRELNNILVADGWRTKDFLQDSASENNIKQINDPEIFHIATHGFFTSEKPIKTELEGIALSNYEALENPLLRTGLLLSGAGDLLAATSYNYNFESGILTAYEAMNLNLDNTKLVVLSACETGLGDVEVGEGVYGLQRAFLVAGAKTLIMSLFKVSDQATQQLMVKFYQKWLSTGNERQAFVDAKKEIRNEFKYPLYWGAFVMIGLEK